MVFVLFSASLSFSLSLLEFAGLFWMLLFVFFFLCSLSSCTIDLFYGCLYLVLWAPNQKLGFIICSPDMYEYGRPSKKFSLAFSTKVVFFLRFTITDKAKVPISKPGPFFSASFYMWENSHKALMLSSDTTVPILHETTSASLPPQESTSQGPLLPSDLDGNTLDTSGPIYSLDSTDIIFYMNLNASFLFSLNILP